jgi:hypothetical protein
MWSGDMRYTPRDYCSAHLFQKFRTKMMKEVKEAPDPIVDEPLRIRVPILGDETFEIQEEDGDNRMDESPPRRTFVESNSF